MNRQRRRAEQYAALRATASDYAAEQDVDQVLSDLRRARKAVAARRRSQG